MSKNPVNDPYENAAQWDGHRNEDLFYLFGIFYGNWVESLGEASNIEDDGKMLIIKGSLGESNEQEEN